MLIFSLYLRPLESDDILLIMHRILLHRAQKAIRFLRWSRKAYAAFCSLHRNVTIGQVGKGIADASLSKAKEVVQVCHVSEVRPSFPIPAERIRVWGGRYPPDALCRSGN